jgi:hypothetical protein
MVHCSMPTWIPCQKRLNKYEFVGYEINKGATGCVAGAEIVSNLLQLHLCRVKTSHCIQPLRAVCVPCHGRKNIFNFLAVAIL